METRTDETDRELEQLDRLESKIGGAWVTWAGVGLLLLALGYFLKYAFDREWLSPLIRVLLGTGAGATLYGVGQGMLHRGYRRSYGLIFLGFGVAALYTSIGSAYFALDLMGPATGLLAMTAITALAVWSGWQYDNQPMGALALLGALVAPAIFPETGQFILQRFAYVYAVAIGAVVLSVLRPWAWIRALAWTGVQVIFLGYLGLVSPQHWKQPFGIAAGFFILFALGLAFESLWMRNRYSWWNLALSLGNATAFAAFTAYLVPNESPWMTVTLLLCSIFYGLLAIIIRRRVPGDQAGAMLHLLAAATLLTVTAPLRLGAVGITVAWTLEAIALWILGARWQHRLMQWAGPVLWFLAGANWLVTCWDVPWPHWFGVPYVPFVNPGAMAWALLAAAGFTFSVWMDKKGDKPAFQRDLASIFALISHLVVGGLLTIQIDNYFEAYPLVSRAATLHVHAAALSVSWGVYALLLVFWGFARRAAMFRWFGLAATGLVLLKVFVFDLSGLETIVKMVALALLGVVFLGIGFLYQRMHKATAAQ